MVDLLDPWWPKGNQGVWSSGIMAALIGGITTFDHKFYKRVKH